LEPDKRYIIGIDLGTTNSAVSFVDLVNDSEQLKIRTLKIPQLTGPGEITRLPVLPSFLYIPGDYDLPSESLSVPWATNNSENKNFVGAFARDHGAKVPARLVSSAKSWLCHSGVDRNARILPWGSGDDVYKISPVQASAGCLEHIKIIWNEYIADEEEDYLENQLVIITVPASFDEVARDLTLEASTIAGYHDVILLEEPLAAFYSWLIKHEGRWSDFVKPNDLILICDVGGGTTDFTLITLQESQGTPRFERIAVGDHLILGGDNIDLTLARGLEMRLGKRKNSLSTDRWKALCHQCREAKEAILDGTVKSNKIVVMGEGGKLIADSVSVELTKEEVEEAVVEGFFPLVASSEAPGKTTRSGITEFGLPYEREPAITKHLTWFIEKHKEDIRKILGRERLIPDLVLFNGGSLKPVVVRKRIIEALQRRFGETDSDTPLELENPHPYQAVALGASYYGLVKLGKGVRVGSGSPRSYFLGIAAKDKYGADLRPGNAICIVERGLDEGSHIKFENHKFEVLANQRVSFDIYSSSYRSGDRCGDLTTIDDTLTKLPPLQTVIQFGKKGASQNIPVSIEAAFTEIGSLAIWCRSLISDHKWKLQFQLREEPAQPEVADFEIFHEGVVNQVLKKIKNAFSNKTNGSRLQSLVRDISNVVEKPKEKWPLSLIRDMADALLEIRDLKNVSPLHESRWLNLTGFCMRPGFGEGFDSRRMAALWKIYLNGMRFSNPPGVRSEWWIMWRRIAGGLKPGQQRQFSQDMTPVMTTKKGEKIKIRPAEKLEIWMALANMELLLGKEKIRWGRLLLKEMSTRKCSPQHFWALSRLGSRTLFYGPVDRVVKPDEVSSWIETILDKNWRDSKPAAAAVAAMARKTGDRVRDIDERLIRRILDWMDHNSLLSVHGQCMTEISPIKKTDEIAMFGESLPAGIILKQA
jgi:molecular chaperone DnaK (HSP70)